MRPEKPVWIVMLSLALLAIKIAVAFGNPADYAESVHLYHWSHFPIAVAFDGKEAGPYRRGLVLKGFDTWVRATHGRVSYKLARRPDTADVVVSVSPDQRYCLTNNDYDDGRVLSSGVSIGLRGTDGTAVDPEALSALSAHEFGHVLGIDGHSPDAGDLMYPYVNASSQISPRDLATLKQAYGW